MSRSWASVPRWRRPLALVGTVFRMVVLYGLRSWWRDLKMVSLGIGSLFLILLLGGFLALGAIGVVRAVGEESGQVSVLRVYLAPAATDAQVEDLRSRLAADPRVASVRLVSSDEAMAQAQGRRGLGTLAGLASSNPFPRSLDLRARRVADVDALARQAAADPAADRDFPTSYDPDAFARLRHWALIAGAIAAGLGLLMAFVAYSVAANSMRSVALARREEVAVMRLLAARAWMLRGPFFIEGLTTGAFAGVFAGAAVVGAWLLVERFANATYAEVLPGVGQAAIQDLVAGILVAGLALGGLTAWNGLRRLGT